MKCQAKNSVSGRIGMPFPPWPAAGRATIGPPGRAGNGVCPLDRSTRCGETSRAGEWNRMSATLGKARSTLAGFERQELVLGGIRTVVHSAGEGTPLVFLHGAGTFTGFSYARGWTRTHRVIIPYHPGFGESADDARIDVIGDYALHCLDLFDALSLGRLHLVGYSFGGWMAAETALLQPDRVARLALVAPSGLVVRDPPAADLLALHPREVPAHLMHRPERL